MTRAPFAPRSPPRRSPARRAALAVVVVALGMAPRGLPASGPAQAADVPDDAEAVVSDVGPVAYRLLALEPLLVAVDARDRTDDDGAAIDLRGDGAWRSAGSAADARSVAAARALGDALSAADGGPAPSASRPSHPRPTAPDRVEERWALVATWEASAVVVMESRGSAPPQASGAGSPDAPWVVARARRCVATPLPPPSTRGGASWWPDDLLRAAPPHPDPRLSARRASPAPRAPWRRARDPTRPAASRATDESASLEGAIVAARRGDLDRARRLLDALLPRDPPSCESLQSRGVGRNGPSHPPGPTRSSPARPGDGPPPPDALSLDWHAEVALATGDPTRAAARLTRLAACLGGGHSLPAGAEGGMPALVTAYLCERAAIASWRAGDPAHRREAVALASRARVRLEAGDPLAARALATWERLARANALDARGDPHPGDRLASRAIDAAASSPGTASAHAGPEGDAQMAAFALAAGDERRAAALLRRALGDAADARSGGSRARASTSAVEDARRRAAAWLEARTR